MRGEIGMIVACWVLAGCGLLHGPRPEPAVSRPVARIGPVEVRQVDARVAVETVADGDEQAARRDGLHRLARYFAAAKLPLTTPLAEAAEGAGHWRISLVLPAGADPAALPKPADPAVVLARLPPETLAVLPLPGASQAEGAAQRTGDLVSTLEGSAWRPAGAPVAFYYGLPGAIERTEVAIPVSPM